MDHDAIRERIKQRLEDLKLAPTGVWLQQNKIGQSTLRKFLNGTNDSIRLVTIERLSGPLETTTDWLLYGPKEGPEPALSEEQLSDIAALASQEIRLGMTIEEIQRTVSSNLAAQLAFLITGSAVPNIGAARTARGKAARSRPHTTPDEQEESHSS